MALADIEIRTRMLVKDVMTSPVITISENSSINEVARLMDEHKIGSIVVTDDGGNPVGIITERDLVVRVLAKNVEPDRLTARDVMTSPLLTVDPDVSLSDAARMMSRLNIRRLGVMYKGRLVGIISSSDILAVTPELIEIIREKARIEGMAMKDEIERPSMAGYCDRCGRWSSNLKEYEGRFLCEECQAELEE